MESRDDKLLALVGFLTAGLIAVTVLFTLTWLSYVPYPAEDRIDTRTCTVTASAPAAI